MAAPFLDRLPAGWHPFAGDRAFLVDVFVAANLAFLTLDVWIAHNTNVFGHVTEYIPLVFAGVGALALLGALAKERGRYNHGWARWVGFAVGIGSILVGVGGMVLHLESQFFEVLTLRRLVYSAPFVAPLAFTGVGLLLLLNRLVPAADVEWGRWVVFLAWAGFVGNFLLSLVDHAQNGFFFWPEWIPVVVAAFGVGYLILVVMLPLDAAYLRLGTWVLAAQAIVGFVGFGLHLAPLFTPSDVILADRIVFGAPIFAPLLFVNLALLAAIGLWDLRVKAREAAARQPVAT